MSFLEERERWIEEISQQLGEDPEDVTECLEEIELEQAVWEDNGGKH